MGHIVCRLLIPYPRLRLTVEAGIEEKGNNQTAPDVYKS